MTEMNTWIKIASAVASSIATSGIRKKDAQSVVYNLIESGLETRNRNIDIEKRLRIAAVKAIDVIWSNKYSEDIAVQIYSTTLQVGKQEFVEAFTVEGSLHDEENTYVSIMRVDEELATKKCFLPKSRGGKNISSQELQKDRMFQVDKKKSIQREENMNGNEIDRKLFWYLMHSNSAYDENLTEICNKNSVVNTFEDEYKHADGGFYLDVKNMCETKGKKIKCSCCYGNQDYKKSQLALSSLNDEYYCMGLDLRKQQKKSRNSVHKNFQHIDFTSIGKRSFCEGTINECNQKSKMTLIKTLFDGLVPDGTFHGNNATKKVMWSTKCTQSHKNSETKSSSSESMMSKSDFDFEEQSTFSSGCITCTGEKLFSLIFCVYSSIHCGEMAGKCSDSLENLMKDCKKQMQRKLCELEQRQKSLNAKRIKPMNERKMKRRKNVLAP